MAGALPLVWAGMKQRQHMRRGSKEHGDKMGGERARGERWRLHSFASSLR